MGTPTHLHIYQCPNDKTIAASTVKIPDPPLLCVLCYRRMRYMWTEPITTDVQRDIARHGVMFNPYIAGQKVDL
jgi:hypothetical protein